MRSLGSVSIPLILLAVVIALPKPALACASCGSGGDDPLILYPNEFNKLYLGLGRTSNFKNIDSDGQFSTAGGPEVKEMATFSAGHSFSTRSFATVTLPYGRNVLRNSTRTSMGDPSFATRYTIVMQSFAEPLIPQVQLTAGYKHAVATSIHDSKEMKTLIDVFGTGFSEAKGGLDVWYGQSNLKIGTAYTFVAPLKRKFSGSDYQPGFGHRATASLGYAFMWFKATIGANRDQRGNMRINGENQPNSSQMNHSAFATTELMLSPVDVLRLSFARQAAFGENRNTAQSQSLTFAYMKAL